MQNLSKDHLKQNIRRNILKEEYESVIGIFAGVKFELFEVINKYVEVEKDNFKLDVFVLKNGEIGFRIDGIVKWVLVIIKMKIA